MKNWLKVTLIFLVTVILLFIVDIVCIFTINRPILAIKESNGDSVNLIYRGLLYDTYNCHEYSTAQIKSKKSKFNCAVSKEDIGKVIDIVDRTKDIDDFACAEALESFYEDSEYVYFWSCIKNSYIVVKYKNGFEEKVSDALKNKTIKISDLDRYNISYLKEKK